MPITLFNQFPGLSFSNTMNSAILSFASALLSLYPAADCFNNKTHPQTMLVSSEGSCQKHPL